MGLFKAFNVMAEIFRKAWAPKPQFVVVYKPYAVLSVHVSRTHSILTILKTLNKVV